VISVNRVQLKYFKPIANH